MTRHAHVTRRTVGKRVKKKKHPTPRGVERNKEADDEEEECLESDGLPNTGTIA